MKLANRVAIVTGGAKGIGKGIAMAFAREGADLVIADIDVDSARSTAGELRELGRRAIAIQADVSEEASVNELVSAVLAEFGRIDILVNNAGIFSVHPFLDLSVDEWDRVLNTNQRGPFLCSRAVAKHMAERGRGAIINISSVDGDVTTGVYAHYSTAKGGIRMLTKSMALGLARYNIRVNAIAPGAIFTTLGGDAEAHAAQVAERVLARIPANRLGRPEEVGAVAVFLASDDSSYVMGTTIFVDGGMTAMGWSDKSFE